MTFNGKGIIFYELNEVPKKIVETYIELKPKSTISKIINRCNLIETYNHDQGELHPWTTWPTLHRGVNNNLHKIQFINQELDKSINIKYPPIWDILQKNKISVGVFGSLQSFPPIRSKYVKYYLPDTFAPSFNALPAELENFQKFNLSLCKDNKAIANSIKSKQYFYFLQLILSNSISINSSVKTFNQVISEIFMKKNKSRRPLLQPILNFDLFIKYLKKEKPNFTTYFTNHVAGMLHRYWVYLYNNDLNVDKDFHDDFYKYSIIKAMDIVDRQLEKLIKVSDKYNYNIVIASSMGQKARDSISQNQDIILNNFSKLLYSLRLNPRDYSELPAMQPDVCIKCANKKSLNTLRSKIKKITDFNNTEIILERYQPVELNLNISLKMTRKISTDSKIKIFDKEKNLNDAGLKMINRDPGTGYHCPEGTLLTYGDKTFVDLFNNLIKNNEIIDTTKITPLILNYFEIDIPSYMSL